MEALRRFSCKRNISSCRSSRTSFNLALHSNSPGAASGGADKHGDLLTSGDASVEKCGANRGGWSRLAEDILKENYIKKGAYEIKVNCK